MSEPARIIVASGLFSDLVLEREYLHSESVEIEFGELDSPEAVARSTEGADGIVLGTSQFSAQHIEALNETVRVIGRPGVGLDNIDFRAAAVAAVGIIHDPDYCDEEVATHALAMILSLARRLPAASRIASEDWNDWSKIAPFAPLSEQTVGIVGGAGRTGSLVVSYIASLAAEVLVCDPRADDLVANVRIASLDELLQQSDIVSLHVPLNQTTRNLIGKQEIERMRPGAALVNISRGGLIDERALSVALQNGHLSGAAVDVLEFEPPKKDAPLLHAPNMLITPHTAWYSSRAENRVRTDTVGAMLDYLRATPIRAGRIALDARGAV